MGWTLAITTGLLLVIGLLRLDPTYATAPRWYWQMKVEWSGVADTVLVGDSQVYRGLDPEAFAAVLGGHVVNFGFSSAGYDAVYLDAVERIVNPRTKTPTIVLGVSPWSLTPLALRQNGFTDAIAQARTTLLPASLQWRLETLNRLTRPFEVERLWQGTSVRQRTTQRTAAEDYLQDFRLNGWVASDYRQRDPSRGLRVARQDHADGNRISQVQLNLLSERVRRWRTRGWIVLAFRPPTPPDVARLTDELSGFDEFQVAQMLAEAGAKWVSLDPAGFESYDGSHLTAESARRLSNILAAQLRSPFPPAP